MEVRQREGQSTLLVYVCFPPFLACLCLSLCLSLSPFFRVSFLSPSLSFCLRGLASTLVVSAPFFSFSFSFLSFPFSFFLILTQTHTQTHTHLPSFIHSFFFTPLSHLSPCSHSHINILSHSYSHIHSFFSFKTTPIQTTPQADTVHLLQPNDTMAHSTTARTAAQAKEQASYLASLYPPWTLLHMLLQHHKPLLSTLLLEALLDNPFSSPLPAVTTTTTAIPSSLSANPLSSHVPAAPWSESRSEPAHSLRRPRAKLSRYLIQRLHFGYYGNRSLFSESAVRYLTARARLEYGYFAIRGRAFWNVSQEDIDSRQQPPEEDGKSDKEVRDKKSKGSSSSRQQQLHQQQQQQSGQGAGPEGVDPTANKDDDLVSLTNSESSTSLGRQQGGGGVGGGTGSGGKTEQLDKQDQQQRMAKAHRRCEEREEILLMMEATRFCERNLPSNTKLESLSPASPIFGQLETGVYWRQVAFTKWINSVEGLSNAQLARIPPSPFLYRRVDAAWMEHMEQLPTNETPILLPSQKSRNRAQQEIHCAQDDARLFQIATGIFEGLATHPKKSRKPARPLIDGPFRISLDILRSLIVDFGYLPLPEDDKQRKIHYRGGDRIPTGEEESFPSDGSHVVNRRGLKGEGTSIWYFYDIQRIEIIVVYLMFRAPEVLNWMFERGFELEPPLGPGGPTFSRTLLLQCCLPGCHAMLRHVFRPTPTAAFMNPIIIISRVNEELLGLGNKPRRVEFQRQDFVEALKGVPAIHLADSLAILTGVGMDTTVVQDRLTELLQISGGPASLDVEKAVLSMLVGFSWFLKTSADIGQ